MKLNYFLMETIYVTININCYKKVNWSGVMKKISLLIIIIILVLNNIYLFNKSFNKFDLNYQNFEVCNESTQIASEVYNNEIYESQIYNNPRYTLFYGEWEVTEFIYADSVPVNGIKYTESELQKVKSNFLKDNKIKKIKFTPDNIIINGSEKINNIIYNVVIFPANDSYKIHFTMTLKDIGLTENKSSYYVFVKMVTKNDFLLEANSFFIKDDNTIILYKDSYCIEYTRISYDEGSSNPVILPG